MNRSAESKAKLAQWDALQLESLKSQGWTNEELIERVKNGDLPKDDSKFQFDYEGLRAFAAEHPDTFQEAVEHGYQIKYNTIRGIHSWILVALKQEAQLILEPGAEAVVASLTKPEADSLASVLSFGWKLTAVDGNASTADSGARTAYRITPAVQ